MGEARPLPFSGSRDIRDGDPFFSPDGSRLFFWSSRPFPGKTAKDTDLWVVERRADDWGEPRRLEPPVNSEINEPFPAVVADGTSTSDRCARAAAGSTSIAPGPAGPGTRSPRTWAPPSTRHSWTSTATSRRTRRYWSSAATGPAVGKIDLYVSRWKDGRSSPARNLGPAVNNPDHEFCPQLIDGGRLLLFGRDTPEAGVFQIDASVLDDATP